MDKFTNYQKFDFVRYNGEICEVTETLECLGLSLVNKDGTYYKNVYVGDVEPILITPEFLEKVGYTYNDFFGTTSYHLNHKFSITSDYYFDSDDKKFTIHTKNFDAIKTKVYYVHQMQELLRICDLDIMILREYIED